MADVAAKSIMVAIAIRRGIFFRSPNSGVAVECGINLLHMCIQVKICVACDGSRN
jgi:hypothetical protein